MQTYERLDKTVIEFGATPEASEFLRRLAHALTDPRVTAAAMTDLVYSAENPVLDKSVVPGKGYVTAAVHADPVYQVMADMLWRKRAQEGVQAPAATMTITQAAQLHGVHPSAIRQAIAAGRLQATKMGGTYFLRRPDVEAFKPARRGPAPKSRLEVRSGEQRGQRFKVNVIGGKLEHVDRARHVKIGYIDRFNRIGVLSGSKGDDRFFELEPADAKGELEFGDFFVRGHFTIARKVNNPKAAREAWRAFGAKVEANAEK